MKVLFVNLGNTQFLYTFSIIMGTVSIIVGLTSFKAGKSTGAVGGTWKLETSGKESSVTRTKETAGLKIPVSTLAMLVFGHISASEAARIGRLDVHDHGALKLWDRVMKTEHMPFCPDMF